MGEGKKGGPVDGNGICRPLGEGREGPQILHYRAKKCQVGRGQPQSPALHYVLEAVPAADHTDLLVSPHSIPGHSLE